MLDIKWIREHALAFDAGLRKRGLTCGGDAKFAAELIALDDARRKIVTQLQEAQARRNRLSKDIGKAKAGKDGARVQALLDEVAALKDELAAGEKLQGEADAALFDHLSVIPNLPNEDVPVGADETGNVEIRRVGEPPRLAVQTRHHYEIGEALGLMDFATAASCRARGSSCSRAG